MAKELVPDTLWDQINSCFPKTNRRPFCSC